MKFYIKYAKITKRIFYSVLSFIVFSFIYTFFISLINVFLFLFVGIFESTDFSNEILSAVLKLILLAEAVIIFVLSFKRINPYIKILPKGIFIYNNNFQHFGLCQFHRINITIPYCKIVKCTKEIPIDCPINYNYKAYNYFIENKQYQEYKRRRGSVRIKEPAIAGGRYDEECILLELDNKRIIVIPIDECAEFLDLFNQYFEQYKILESKSSDLRQ